MVRHLSQMAILFVMILSTSVLKVGGSLHDLAALRYDAVASRLATAELVPQLEDDVEPAFLLSQGGAGGTGNLRGADEEERTVISFLTVAEATTNGSSFVTFIVIMIAGVLFLGAGCFIFVTGWDRFDKGSKGPVKMSENKPAADRSSAMPPASLPPARSGSLLPPTQPVQAPMAQDLLSATRSATSSEVNLSDMLLVNSPDGGNFVIAGEIGPHPEEDVITVTDAKTGGVQAKVFISETGSNPQIHVETSNHIPVAVMDTASAIYAEDTTPPERRFVNVHKPGGTRERPWARIHVEWGDNQCACVVQKLGPSGHASGLLLMVRYDENEEMKQAVGPGGDVVARPQAMRTQDGQESRYLWVKQGTDFALVLCAALAFRKLS